MVWIVLGFLGSAAVVIAGGIVLARSGDVIGARTSLGGMWVGSILLAVATSLPELTTDISAIRLGAPDLAAGDLFGSSMANMLILACVSLLPGSDLFRRAALDNTLTASLAIIVTAMAAIAILMRPSASLLGAGYGAFAIATVYFVGTRSIYGQSSVARRAAEVVETAPADAPPRPPAEGRTPTLKRALLAFAAAAIVILLAAPLFAGFAKALADATGLEQSFVGTWLVGVSTSLPELVTSLAAVRIGAYDLAVGNLFGSNALNMVMLLPLDAMHRAGPLLGTVHAVHAVSALVAVVLMAVGLAAIVSQAGRKPSMLHPGSGLIIAGYFAGLAIIFALGR